ncbi:hypothetical protein BDQ94DRAFT_154804, partial [Aspergillus welwitschiae]
VLHIRPEPCRPKKTRVLELWRDDLEFATIALGQHRTPTRRHAIVIERKLSCVLDLYPSQ